MSDKDREVPITMSVDSEGIYKVGDLIDLLGCQFEVTEVHECNTVLSLRARPTFWNITRVRLRMLWHLPSYFITFYLLLPFCSKDHPWKKWEWSLIRWSIGAQEAVHMLNFIIWVWVISFIIIFGFIK